MAILLEQFLSNGHRYVARISNPAGTTSLDIGGNANAREPLRSIFTVPDVQTARALLGVPQPGDPEDHRLRVHWYLVGVNFASTADVQFTVIRNASGRAQIDVVASVATGPDMIVVVECCEYGFGPNGVPLT